jgi:hypothetical protein
MARRSNKGVAKNSRHTDSRHCRQETVAGTLAAAYSNIIHTRNMRTGNSARDSRGVTNRGVAWEARQHSPAERDRHTFWLVSPLPPKTH